MPTILKPILATILMTVTARAETVTIGPESDIQSIVDLMNHGDVIQLEPGTYEPVEPIRLGSKAITIIGSVGRKGRPTSIIDGRDQTRLFEWGHAEDRAGESPGPDIRMRFQNLVLTRGWSEDRGGAVTLVKSERPPAGSGGFVDAIFVNCIFQANRAGLGGGAMRVEDGRVDFFDCRFVGNRSLGEHQGGGAIEERDAFTFHRRSTFLDNQSAGNGGAVRASHGFGEYEDCRFESNAAEKNGGAVSRDSGYGSVGYFDGCEFIENRAERDGGHIYATMMMGFADDCHFEDGSAGFSGGAIFLEHSLGPLIDDCTFVANEAHSGGGGAMYIGHSLESDDNPTSVRKSRFQHNVAAVGGAILDEASDTRFNQNLFEGNRAIAGPGGACYHIASDCSFHDDEFTGNESATSGGALHFVGALSSPNLRFCLISGNHAPVGGGITNLDTGLEIGGSTICSNSVGQIDAGPGYLDGGGNHIAGNCTCRFDIDGDETVGAGDLSHLLSAWGTIDPACDFNGDGVVGSEDLGLLFAAWGPCG